VQAGSGPPLQWHSECRCASLAGGEVNQYQSPWSAICDLGAPRPRRVVALVAEAIRPARILLQFGASKSGKTGSKKTIEYGAVRIASATRLLPARSRAKTQIRDQGGLNWFHLPPARQAHRHSECPLKRGPATGWATITFTGTRRFSNVRALRATFAVKDGDCSTTTLIGKGLENLEEGLRPAGLHQLRRHPQPVFDEQKKTVSLESISTKASPLCLPHRVHGQYHHPRQGDPARVDARRRPGLQLPVVGVQLLRLNQLEYFELSRGAGLGGPPGCEPARWTCC